MEKLLWQVLSIDPQACPKPCWADISTSVVATQELARGSKVAAGAVQIVNLSVERDISALSLSGWRQPGEMLCVFCFLKGNEKEKFWFGWPRVFCFVWSKHKNISFCFILFSLLLLLSYFPSFFFLFFFFHQESLAVWPKEKEGQRRTLLLSIRRLWPGGDQSLLPGCKRQDERKWPQAALGEVQVR